MFAQTLFSVVLLVPLQTDRNARSASAPTTRVTQPAPPPLDAFPSDGLGLLSKKDSDALTRQAKSGINAATKIQPFRSAQALRNYKTVVHSSAILTNFPLLPQEEQGLNDKIDGFLKRSRRVTLATFDDAQAAVYSAISIRRDRDGAAMLEVMLGVSDWADARARKADGPVAALSKSTVWLGVSRRKLSWEAISTEGRPSYDKLAAEIESLYKDEMDNLLLAF